MKRKGFTLIEILLVVAGIAILAGIVILAINPGKQLGQARDSQRAADVRTILDAVYQYSIDHSGALPVELPTDATEICNILDAVQAPVVFSPKLMSAQVLTSNKQSILNVRTSCQPDEVLASSGDVQPVRNELCAQTGTWNIMELDGGKKLSGSGYGCRVENQNLNEGFGHQVCKAAVEVPEPEAPEPTLQSEALTVDCVDLSFLAEDGVYLTDLPEDPLNESETGIGYTIHQTESGRIAVAAPNTESGDDIQVKR